MALFWSVNETHIFFRDKLNEFNTAPCAMKEGGRSCFHNPEISAHKVVAPLAVWGIPAGRKRGWQYGQNYTDTFPGYTTITPSRSVVRCCGLLPKNINTKQLHPQLQL